MQVWWGHSSLINQAVTLTYNDWGTDALMSDNWLGRYIASVYVALNTGQLLVNGNPYTCLKNR